MNNDKQLFDEINNFRKVLKNKYRLQDQLLDLIKEKFPNVKEVFFSDSSFEVTTEAHTWRYSEYSSYNAKEPSMICEKQEMPKTYEEFEAMKNFMEKDKQQCMTAFYFIKFRYHFGE